MLVAVPERVPTALAVTPWPDPVLDELGHDPRSQYVERFWLGILGPSSVLLLRRLAAELEASPAGFSLPVEDTARTMGLSVKSGRNSPFLRTLLRCDQFHLLSLDLPGERLLVRRRLPPLTRGQVAKLPPPLQTEHEAWQSDPRRAGAEQRARSRRLALSLLELGEGVERAEWQLLRWKYPPSLAREATAWAWRRHQDAAAAAAAAVDEPDPAA